MRECSTYINGNHVRSGLLEPTLRCRMRDSMSHGQVEVPDGVDQTPQSVVVLFLSMGFLWHAFMIMSVSLRENSTSQQSAVSDEYSRGTFLNVVGNSTVPPTTTSSWRISSNRSRYSLDLSSSRIAAVPLAPIRVTPSARTSSAWSRSRTPPAALTCT